MDFLAATLPLTTLLFLTGICLSVFTAPIAIRFANHFGIVDMPGKAEHKKHERPTPLAGGIVIAVNSILLFLLFRGHYSLEMQGILLATGAVFITGLVDDSKGLNAQWKFSGQIFASLVLVSFGTQIAFVDMFSPEVNYSLNIFLTVFWLVGMANAFNLVDSGDGLSLSLGGIASGLLIFASLVANQEQLSFQAGALLGIIMGLLIYNLPPAQLFLGDSGSQTIGFFLAALAIHYSPEGRPQGSSWFVPITLVAVPIFDVCLVFFSRLRRHKPFYLSDLGHTYHRLKGYGLSHIKAVWAMDLAALFIGGIGLFALFQAPMVANLIFAGIVLVGIVTLILFDRSSS